METESETIANWADQAKMTIAIDKTKGIILKGKLIRAPSIRCNGQVVRFVEEVSYLGVTLDKGLTFLPHVKAVTGKSRALFGKITRMIRIKYGVKSSQLLFLYKTVFVPIVSYAFRTWQHRLDHTHVMRKVKEAQRQVLIESLI